MQVKPHVEPVCTVMLRVNLRRNDTLNSLQSFIEPVPVFLTPLAYPGRFSAERFRRLPATRSSGNSVQYNSFLGQPWCLDGDSFVRKGVSGFVILARSRIDQHHAAVPSGNMLEIIRAETAIIADGACQPPLYRVI